MNNGDAYAYGMYVFALKSKSLSNNNMSVRFYVSLAFVRTETGPKVGKTDHDPVVSELQSASRLHKCK